MLEENAGSKLAQKTSQETTEIHENIGAGLRRLKEAFAMDTDKALANFEDELKAFKLENIENNKLKTEYNRVLNRIKRYTNLLKENEIQKVLEADYNDFKRIYVGESAYIQSWDIAKTYYTSSSGCIALNRMLRSTDWTSIRKKTSGIKNFKPGTSLSECIQYNLRIALKRKREIEIISILDKRMISEIAEPVTVYRGGKC